MKVKGNSHLKVVERFDGDEMNLHVPQSIEAQTEIQELMMVPTQIVSPQANRPVIGLVQDALLGSNLITQRDTFLEKDLVMNMLMWWDRFDGRLPIPAILKPQPLWTGKQIFSLLLEKNLNVETTSKTHDSKNKDVLDPDDTRVIIQQGEIMSGMLDKKTLGTSQGSLVHIIMNENGPEATKRFLGQTQQLVNYWLLQVGFSVGISDTIADPQTRLDVERTIKTAKNDVHKLIKQAQQGRLECKPGMNLEQSLEANINGVLNKARDNAGLNATASLHRNNRINRMVTAGSKGSPINLSQIIACVGQQSVEGQRIPFKFIERTLPHFSKYDNSPESRGFVENSFISGLTPQQFFFHAMGGREGLIDTAVKTSDSGYIQRRLIKAMEDIQIKYDGTVRNSLGDIIQFRYGEDGLDAVHVETQTLESLKMSPQRLSEVYEWDNSDCPEEVTQEFTQIVADQKELQDKIIPNGESRWPLPVHLKRLIKQAKLHKSFGKSSMIWPDQIIRERQALEERLTNLPGLNQDAVHLFCIHLRSMLASKRVIKEYKLNQPVYQWLLQTIENRYCKAIVQPGEMVGAIAAQSIGEPATQMTLNTFHYAGVSSKNVTLGIPRLKELINVAKNMKTPSLTVYLKSAHDKQKAKNVQRALEFHYLRSIVKSVKILYDPDPVNTTVPEDQMFVRFWYLLPLDELEDLNPWVLRFELDSNLLFDQGLTVAQIVEKIQFYFDNNTLHCIYSDDNTIDPVIRLRLTTNECDDMSQLQELLLDNVVLKGVNDIQKVFMREEKINEFSQDTEWVLDTEGTNLLDVMAVPEVDFTRTVSNNVIEIFETLGIEAARSTLLKELKQVLSFDGSYVNHRHLATLVDIMTYRGHLMSITRHGVNRTETGPLTRCSFEETADILLEAAIFSEMDNMKGVTDNVLIGQLAPLGTGHVDLYLDTDKLKSLPEIAPGPLTENTTKSHESQTETTLQYFDEIDYRPQHKSPTITVLPSIRPTLDFPVYQEESISYYDRKQEHILHVFNYEPNTKPRFEPTKKKIE